jgi:hypothetical protein
MVRIRLKDLKVGTLSDSSGIFYGQNHKFGWKTTDKTNEGFGRISGAKNVSTGNFSILNDPETVDIINSKPTKRGSK